MKFVCDEPKDVSRKAVSGVVWTLGAQISTQVTRFLVAIVLARLLPPSDFGLISMIYVFTGFAELFSDCGFSQVLVQRQKIEERHLSTVFWVNLLMGSMLGCLIAGLSPVVAKFYKEPRLGSLMMLFAVGFPVSSLNVVQKAILYRAMRYRALGLIETGSTFLSGVVGITLALHGFGARSMVLQFLLLCSLVALVTWCVGGWRPRWIFDRRAVAELLGFSANLTAFSSVNYWFRNGDNLLVGKYFGAWALGIYARAYNLMLLPLSQVTFVITKVMFPILSRLQQEPERVKSLYLRMIGMIALVTFPLMLGLFATTAHFVIAAFGTAWAEMVPVLRIFCILGMIQSITSTNGVLFQSQGRTDWQFWWGTISGGGCISAIVVGVRLGSLVAIASSLLLVSLILLPLYFSIPGKLVGLTVRDVVRTVWVTLACAAAMACSIGALEALLPKGWSHMEYLAIEVLFGMVVYLFLVHVFRVAAYRDLRGIIAQELQRRNANSLAFASGS